MTKYSTFYVFFLSLSMDVAYTFDLDFVLVYHFESCLQFLVFFFRVIWRFLYFVCVLYFVFVFIFVVTFIAIVLFSGVMNVKSL